MTAAKVIVFALLLIGCCCAQPLRMATIYDSPLVIVPVLVEGLEEAQVGADQGPVYSLDGSLEGSSSFDVVKRSVQETADEEDDLETAAGSNILRPLFVYRQQIAYRQRARDAIRRGRQI